MVFGCFWCGRCNKELGMLSFLMALDVFGRCSKRFAVGWTLLGDFPVRPVQKER